MATIGYVTSGTCEAVSQKPTSDTETLGQCLDQRIAQARKNLEELCITKAKAEAMQMLNTPMDFMRKATW